MAANQPNQPKALYKLEYTMPWAKYTLDDERQGVPALGTPRAGIDMNLVVVHGLMLFREPPSQSGVWVLAEEDVEPLREQLTVIITNLDALHYPHGFFTHQWFKHGMHIFPQSVMNYFQTIINNHTSAAINAVLNGLVHHVDVQVENGFHGIAARTLHNELSGQTGISFTMTCTQDANGRVMLVFISVAFERMK